MPKTRHQIAQTAAVTLPLASEQSPIAIRDNKVVGVGSAHYDAQIQGVKSATASK